ncbi:MAG: riboflavin synthase [Bacteroidia bacterium]
MFTGIIEKTGKLVSKAESGSNIDFWFQSEISNDLKIDQSLAHNGVCLTVVELKDGQHRVTAIAETLEKTNLGELRENQLVNLERCMPVNGRFDGHIVQGHVDETGICIERKETEGSWYFRFRITNSVNKGLLVNKGSICINGVSLTVVEAKEDWFSVAIIPYTYNFTNFNEIKVGSKINLEFDILGKYVQKQLDLRS